MTNVTAKYSLLKRKYNQKEEENLCLREKIREYECNRYNSSGVSQASMTRLEMERDAAKGDCVRLREENNALRDEIQRLKENQRGEQGRLDQAKKDFDNCVAQFDVERRGLCAEIEQLTDELRQSKDRVRELQADSGDHRTRCNHLKMVHEQTERELRTTQDLLHQTEAELASALDRIQELNDEMQRLQWELKEARQERTCIKANMSRLDQEKDTLLLKVDEKTEQIVRVEAELESRDRRIASLEGFIADLQKKLDVALDTAARSEQTSRQHTLETERLRIELDKMDRCRDNAVRENSRLQEDLAAITQEYQQTTRSLEAARREVEDLKLQLQGYVAEVRRITEILEEKETERMAMLEHYRSLTVESANLETNNHSLESEARSTKSCLREAHNRIQDLEAGLQEKQALVHGYEKQIKELTQQVAKLERKLNSRSRAESASKDLSRELESQKHCMAQTVEKLTVRTKQLDEEVGQLRMQVSHLHDQLGKERKNSATLENVLASSRQETMQRTKDNSELKAQVHALQTKLRELQDKLEHGTEALRRCQSECSDYQVQVAELHREVTNERFERSRVEETKRRSRPIKRPLKRPALRSRSLISLRAYKMAPSYVCPCCFLNRISSLRNTPEASKELMSYKYNCEHQTNKHEENLKTEFLEKCFSENPDWLTSNVFQEQKNHYLKNKVCSEVSTLGTDSLSAYKFDSGNFSEESEEFMLPERLTNSSKQPNSMKTFVVGVPEDKTVGKQYISDTTIDSLERTEMLAEQIDYMLREQKKFLKELDLPIHSEGRFRLEIDQAMEPQSAVKDDSKKKLITVQKASKSKRESNKTFKIDKSATGRIELYASGDQSKIWKTDECKSSNKTFNVDIPLEGIINENKRKSKKPVVHFNEEPVKLGKTFEWVLPVQQDNDLNKDFPTDKNISVKMLFFPENELQCSTSSMGSQTDKSVAASSVYVTAANSYTDTYRESVAQAAYTVAHSSSDTSLIVIANSRSRVLSQTDSEARDLIDSD